jgi:hypothetical protein
MIGGRFRCRTGLGGLGGRYGQYLDGKGKNIGQAKGAE